MVDQNIMSEIQGLLGTSEACSPLRLKLQEAQFEWPPGALSYFLPINKLTELVTTPSVKEELHIMLPKLKEEYLEQFATMICSDSKKLFAILLCEFGPNAKIICNLLDENVTDKDLSFTRIFIGENSPNVPNPRWYAGRKNHVECDKADHRSCKILSLAGWAHMDIQKLCKGQWLALAPIFESPSGEIPQLDLDDNALLPFTMDQEFSPLSVKGGGYGEVWKVRIHPAHQKILPSTDSDVIAPPRVY
jgi:hypothetical protein